jgi:hypothetical protein
VKTNEKLATNRVTVSANFSFMELINRPQAAQYPPVACGVQIIPDTWKEYLRTFEIGNHLRTNYLGK